MCRLCDMDKIFIRGCLMRWQWISNLGISQKLALLICPPILGALIAGSIIIKDEWQLKSNLNVLLRLTELAQRNSNLVHQLQKERGMSAGFIGSNGNSFKNQLGSQRKLVNQEIQKLRNKIKHSEYSKDIEFGLKKLEADLSKINNIRQQVDLLQISLKDQVSFYTSLNKQLLSVVDVIAKQAKEQQISLKVAAFSSFLQMKERAGIERAVLSSTFGQQQIPNAKFARFLNLLAEQKSYQDRFIALSSNADSSAFKSKLASSTSVREVQRLRSAVQQLDLNTVAATAPESWFKAATGRIELLRKFEQKLANEIIELTEQKRGMAETFLIIGAGSMILLVLLILTLTLSIARQLISNIKSISNSVAKAGNNLDLTIRIDDSATDELGELAKSFNAMMNEFEQVLISTKASSSLIANAVEHINQASEEMQSDVVKGQSQAEQVAAAMTELSTTVSQIASNAADAAQASSEAAKEAEEGNTEVAKTDKSIGELSDEMHAASNAINNLDKEIHGIVGVLDVISGIAEQTNLLALNAAIEAARAGETGRGFAVVADEVRSLAQRAKASTADIKNMTDRLQLGAEEAVQAMSRGLDKATESVEEVKLAGDDLNQIVQFVGTIDEMNIQIATATEQQSAVTEEVSNNAIEINELYINSSHISKKIKDLNQELAMASTDLDKRVQQFIVS